MTEEIRWQRVLWRRVLGVAAVQGAITLTWVIYDLYFAKLLIQLGFSAGLAAGVLIVENAIAAFMEPLMGGLSDHKRQWISSKLSFMTLGILLASGLFILIPTTIVFGNAQTLLRWLLPILAIAWATSMTVFRSPVISLLAQAAPVSQLPIASSLLMLVGGLVGAATRFSQPFILSLGAIFTFAIGSFALLGAGVYLRSYQPAPVSEIQENPPVAGNALGVIALTGFSIAWGTRSLMTGISQFVKIQFPTISDTFILFGFGVFSALAALCAGWLATKWGNRRIMLISIAGIIGLMAMMQGIPAIAILTLMGIAGCFSAIANGAIPFVFALVPVQRGGLGIGTYFGGFTAAMSCFGLIFSQPPSLSQNLLISSLAFLIAGLWITISFSLKAVQPSLAE